MKLKYIIKKIYNKLAVNKIKKYAIDDNLFLLNKKDKKITSIMFYFPDYEMMHFGDHLFFEPLARELKVQGYEIFVYPIKAMEFYFTKLGFSLAKDLDTVNIDLIITTVSFLPKLYNSDEQVLFIDTTNPKIKTPLCNDIINKVFKFLDITAHYNATPSNIDVKSKYIDSLIDKNKIYVLFNNYLDSGSFRSGKKDQNKICQFTENFLQDTQYQVIHTGSQKDKDKDKNRYPFVDIDLRGKTSIEELFYLARLDNIKYNISFDAFQMHLFFINKKKSFILFRGRYLKKNEMFIKNFVNPPFQCDKNNSLIDYIK